MKKAAINLDDISRVLKEHKTEVRRKHNVTKIGIFRFLCSRGTERTKWYRYPCQFLRNPWYIQIYGTWGVSEKVAPPEGRSCAKGSYQAGA